MRVGPRGPQRRVVRRPVRRTWKTRLPTPDVSRKRPTGPETGRPMRRVDSGRVLARNGERNEATTATLQEARCKGAARKAATERMWTGTAPSGAESQVTATLRSGGKPSGSVRTGVGKTARCSQSAEPPRSKRWCQRRCITGQPNPGSWMCPHADAPVPLGNG